MIRQEDSKEDHQAQCSSNFWAAVGLVIQFRIAQNQQLKITPVVKYQQ